MCTVEVNGSLEGVDLEPDGHALQQVEGNRHLMRLSIPPLLVREHYRWVLQMQPHLLKLPVFCSDWVNQLRLLR